MTWRKIWAELGAGTRVRELEAEVARLRGENRALMNSILGIAGVPPVIVADAVEAGAAASGTTGRVGAKKDLVPPMRRRSWHQVHRMLEIDAARKKDTNPGAER
jgi:hypothetical protein